MSVNLLAQDISVHSWSLSRVWIGSKLLENFDRPSGRRSTFVIWNVSEGMSVHAYYGRTAWDGAASGEWIWGERCDQSRMRWFLSDLWMWALNLGLLIFFAFAVSGTTTLACSRAAHERAQPGLFGNMRQARPRGHWRLTPMSFAHAPASAR